MKIDKFNSAIDHIDYDLVDEFVRERDAIERKKEARRTLIRLAPIAACFVIFMSVGAWMLGYSVAGGDEFDKSNQNLAGEVQMLFSKEGKFVFEYEGKLYQAYVTPMMDSDEADVVVSGSVSIQNVGECITNVTVTDENGNEATMEIYSAKNNSSGSSILLKLNGGYFNAVSD